MDWEICILVLLLVIVLAIIVYLVQTNDFPELYSIWGGGADANEVDDVDGGYELQEALRKKYKHLKSKKKTFEEMCYPKSYTLQPQQIFVGDYVASLKKNKSLLVFHRIGAGKTCAGIQIAKHFVDSGKVLFVLPASLMPSLYAELATPCGDKIKSSRIDVMSYNKFATAPPRYTPSILIIDEVQNVYNKNGVFYNCLKDFIDKKPDMPVVIMSGTPIFDNIGELHSIAGLLRIQLDDISIPAMRAFEGHVSFFKGAPKETFPSVTIIEKRLNMSSFQSKWYRGEIEAEERANGSVKLTSVSNDFYIKSRQKSNIVFPHGLTGPQGIDKLTTKIIRDDLYKYSAKFDFISKKLGRNLSMIYTSFTNEYGILALKKILGVYGFKNFADYGPGPKRYAIFSGEESKKYKERIRVAFNSEANDNASQLQIIIGSPAIKEGVSLYRLAYIFVLEAYWNFSRLEQIYGRGYRYCSHKRLPASQRKLTIYLLCGVSGNEKTPLGSIDKFMLRVAAEKKRETDPYIRALINVAVDKYLY